jgi:cell wall-associated NlpC family hydrolase
MRLCILFATIAAALASVPIAGATTTYARVLGPGGATLAVGSGSQFAYPADGSLLAVGSVQSTPNDVTLENVQLFGGQVELMQVDVPVNGSILFGDLIVGGKVISPVVPNTLIPVGGIGYVVVDQTARASGHLGRVALRLVTTSPDAGVPKGTQVLIGMPGAETARVPSAARRTAFDPLAALGFSAAVSESIGFSAAPSSTSGSTGERAVAIAEQFLGVPYVWGGASPIPGFDCSGLAMYVYAQLGVTLTHYTGAQIQEGLPIDRADLAPGDLVFFDANPVLGPQHEGIYIGGGRFIQAPHTGDVVKISSLDDPAYGLSYVGAVRPYVR